MPLTSGTKKKSKFRRGWGWESSLEKHQKRQFKVVGVWMKLLPMESLQEGPHLRGRRSTKRGQLRGVSCKIGSQVSRKSGKHGKHVDFKEELHAVTCSVYSIIMRFYLFPSSSFPFGMASQNGLCGGQSCITSAFLIFAALPPVYSCTATGLESWAISNFLQKLSSLLTTWLTELLLCFLGRHSEGGELDDLLTGSEVGLHLGYP